MSEHLFLIGFMGAGKSTVGHLAADKLGRAFLDCDDMVEMSAGARVKEIFSAEGEAGFRERETKALASLEDVPPVVAACGGGVVVRDENRALLKMMGSVIYLRVTAGEALARVGEDDSRPLLAGDSGALAATLLQAREAMYEAVADATIDTVGKSPEQVADLVVATYNEMARS